MRRVWIGPSRQPTMSRERGFRRLTLGVSLVLLCAGLALTARDVYRMMEYRNTLTIEEECRSRAGSDQKAKDECGSTNATFPSHVLFAIGALVTISQAALSYNTFINVLDVTTGRPGYPFFGFIMSLDLAVSLVLAALPWAIFYFVRWIARGFG